MSQDAANNGLIDKEKYVIPPHLHDLQEADLPETQRGLVISEIAQFRERAAKREREKMRDVRESIPSIIGAPSGPKAREWGKSQNQARGDTQQAAGRAPAPQQGQAQGKGPQGYSKPVGFVKAEGQGSPTGAKDDERRMPGRASKTDEELEAERKEARRRDEEVSFRDVRESLALVKADSDPICWLNSASVDMNLGNGTVFKPSSERSHASEQ